METAGTNTEEKGHRSVLLYSAFILIGGYFAYTKISFALSHETTDNAHLETMITPVLPRVSGYVKTVAVGDYDSVKENQLVVTLDDDEMQAQLPANGNRLQKF